MMIKVYLFLNAILNIWLMSFFWQYAIPILQGWGIELCGAGFLAWLGLPSSCMKYLWAAVSVLLPAVLAQLPSVQHWFCYMLGARKLEGIQGMRIQEAMNVACAHADVEPERFNLYMKYGEEINAFTCGKNNVIVYTGASSVLSIPDLSGIIAHELGHLKNGDSSQSITLYLMGLLPNKFMEVLQFVADFFYFGRRWGMVFAVAGYVLSIICCVFRFILTIPFFIAAVTCGFNGGEKNADKYACEIGLGMYLYSALSIIKAKSNRQAPLREELINGYGTHEERLNDILACSKDSL